MDDVQALRTLQRIEKLLEAAMASVKSDVTEDRKETTRAGGKPRGKKSEGAQFNMQVVRASTRLGVLSDETNKLTTATAAARKQVFNLAADVSSARDNVFAFSTAAKSLAGSISTLRFDEQNALINEQGGLVGTLSQSTLLASSQLDTLTGTSRRLNKAFETMVGTVVKSSVVTAETGKTNTEVTDLNTRATEENTQETRQSGSFFNRMLRRFGVNLQEGGDRAEWFSNQLSNLSFALSDALINVIKDVYSLSARGIQASDSLFELYGNAIKAGMSLEEYTSMLGENAAAVVRFGSFSEFGDSIDRTTRQLNRLGIFGPAAEQLAASMKTNAVALGVPMAQQEGMIDRQVKVFEQLRKTTLMTADGFRELVADISSNENVQEQLLGLAPQERAARQMQIMQIATIGQRLGATAEASKSLTDALLAQRKSTVKDRFKAQGVVRQAGAITGMNAARTEELSRLALKNPATLTAAETERMTQLFTEFEARLQTLKNTGNLAAENIADELLALRSSVSAGQVSQAAGRVGQQVQAGPAINTETGKTASGLQQDVGQALTVLSGFMKNPLADSMVILAGMLAQSIWQVKWLKKIEKNTSKGVDEVASKGKKGIASKLGSLASGALGSILGINSIPLDLGPGDVMGGLGKGQVPEKGIKAMIIRMLGIDKLSEIPLSLTESDFGMGSAGVVTKQTLKQKLLGAIRSMFGFGKGVLSKGGLAGMVFSSIEELFTGNLTSALDLGDGLGGRLLGAITGAFNGLFTGFTRLIDGGINWVMEGLGISWRSNLTTFVDDATLAVTSSLKLFTSFFVQGWNSFKAAFYEGIASLLDALPFVRDDAPWLVSARAAAKEANDNVKAEQENRDKILQHYSDTRQKLYTEDEHGKMKTLREIGAEQVKAQKETADRVKAMTRETQDNVVYGAENVMAAVNRHVDGLRSGVAAAPGGPAGSGVVGMPQPTRQSAVTPPEVNRAQVEQERRRDVSAASTITVVGMTELVANAQQQLDVLKQMLQVAMQKQETAEAEAPLTGPTFADNSQLFNNVMHAA